MTVPVATLCSARSFETLQVLYLQALALINGVKLSMGFMNRSAEATIKFSQIRLLFPKCIPINR